MMYNNTPKPNISPLEVSAPIQAYAVDERGPRHTSSFWSNRLHEGLLLKQKTPTCCRVCCLQPNIDWVVWPVQDEVAIDEEGEVIMFVKEEAPYCGRCFSWCAPGFRPTIFTAYEVCYIELITILIV
jgi:hypothetical protein